MAHPQRSGNVVMKPIVVIIAVVCGALLNGGGAWIVHHDHINYSLPVVVSTAAETAFALGPVLWGVGVILAVPLALAYVRHVRSFWKLVSIEVIAYLALVCGLGSVSALGLSAFLGATLFLWAMALIVAVASPIPQITDAKDI
jgi:hypothetical protein